MNLVPEQKGFPWKRLAAVAVTVFALWLVFRKINPQELFAVLRGTRPGWFLAAVGVFGVTVVCAAWRWHLMLRMTGAVVHLLASIRLYFIGFGIGFALLGPAVGDLAKSALYARWFRVPLPPIIAAAPLDRALGLAGMAIFCAGALVFAAFKGVFAPGGALEKFRVPLPLVAAGVVAGIVGIVIVFRWRFKSDSAVARTFNSFAEVAAKLLASPTTALPGLALGFIVQALSCLLLALCLKAVVTVDCPWATMLWTFPVIGAMTAMPSVGGLGVREAASVVLLRPYGVPEADAAAASLLVFAVNIVWAAVGGGLLWREGKVIAKSSGNATNLVEPRTLSIVIPALNAAAELGETIRHARKIPEVVEILVVDGGSTDATRQIAEQSGARVVASEPGHGKQLLAGATAAGGDVVVFLNADTWLPAGAGKAALAALRDPTVVGGGFWASDSKASCFARLVLAGQVAGEQAVFVRRNVLTEAFASAEVSNMENGEFCRRLRKAGRLALTDATVTTARR
ncbi:MAG: flippase-like domain-containing protein [Verrucomicrobia bacterium]|nr:flippase-like domain-containing protein [Verrucomicrobiota bacterium]